MVHILTNKERSILERKMSNKRLNQSERNRLSKSIRPKLREMSLIDSKNILSKIEYNQKSVSIENHIIKTIKENVPELDSIILYGSVVQSNYQEYNDIDIMIVTKEKMLESQKYEIKSQLKKILKENQIVSDIEMISRENLLQTYKNSPTLIYQLKDCKIIYGKIKIPNKIEIYNADLHMKLDWSDVEDIEPDGKDIYGALRNTILVRLLLRNIIDNSKLKESLYDELGKSLIERLKNNQQSKQEKRYSLNYLKNLIEDTRNQIKGGLWERAKISR